MEATIPSICVRLDEYVELHLNSHLAFDRLGSGEVYALIDAQVASIINDADPGQQYHHLESINDSPVFRLYSAKTWLESQAHRKDLQQKQTLHTAIREELDTIAKQIKEFLIPYELLKHGFRNAIAEKFFAGANQDFGYMVADGILSEKISVDCLKDEALVKALTEDFFPEKRALEALMVLENRTRAKLYA